ncbi:MAG: 30S ribosome-binding factor RbfA [Phycisphaerales bacterium]
MSRSGPGHRREAIASEIRSALQALLARGLNDPRVQGMVTITGVDVDQQLARALVRVSVIPEKYQVRVLAGLRHAAGHLRRQVGETIKTIRIPELAFEIDTGLKRQAEVIEALSRVAAEREARGERDPRGPLDAPPDAANNQAPASPPGQGAGDAEESAHG